MDGEFLSEDLGNLILFFGIDLKALGQTGAVVDGRSHIGWIVVGGYTGLVEEGRISNANVIATKTGAWMTRMAVAVDARSFVVSASTALTQLNSMNARGHGVSVRCVKYHKDSNY